MFTKLPIYIDSKIQEKFRLKKAAFWRDENLRNLIRIFCGEITKERKI